MELREYLFRKRLKANEFADLIGYHRQYVGRVINGKANPGKKFIKAVKEATNDEVTFENREDGEGSGQEIK